MSHKLYEALNGRENVRTKERRFMSRDTQPNGTTSTLGQRLGTDSTKKEPLYRRFVNRVAEAFSSGKKSKNASKIEDITRNAVENLKSEGYSVACDADDEKGVIFVGDESNGYNLVNRIENVEKAKDVPQTDRKYSPVMTEGEKEPVRDYGMRVDLEEGTRYDSHDLCADIGPVRTGVSSSKSFADDVSMIADLQLYDI